MRVVVSNTTPIRYLVLIGESDLLPTLYQRVVIPDSVARELSQPQTPEVVRQWIARPPSWFEPMALSQPPDPTRLPHLDLGERDAILLALEINADLVLMDERDGVEEATRLGLRVTGTLGVLVRAAEKRLIDLADVIERLRATNFRVSPALLDRLLADDAQRRGWAE